MNAERAGGIVVSSSVKTDPCGNGDRVLRVRRGVGSVAVDGQRTLQGRNVDLLIIGTSLDEDRLSGS